jgi:hypothetical protein
MDWKNVACATLALAACSGNIDFKSYRSAEGGFTVKVPVLPTESTTLADTPFGKVLEHDFVANYDPTSPERPHRYGANLSFDERARQRPLQYQIVVTGSDGTCALIR